MFEWSIALFALFAVPGDDGAAGGLLCACVSARARASAGARDALRRGGARTLARARACAAAAPGLAC